MPTTLDQPAPSFADVWRMFQETDLKFKETDLKFKETDRKFQETTLTSWAIDWAILSKRWSSRGWCGCFRHAD